MKKALILGANAGQADIIRYLKDNNWEVHACGNSNGMGVSYADYFYDISTNDADLIKQLAKKINADIVYSVSSDINIRTATVVSEELGLPVLLNSKIIDLFHFKDKLRSYLNQNGISYVNYKRITSVEDISNWEIFPCVIKPVDSQGQRGVKILETNAGITEHVKTAINISPVKSAILEEYLKGTEISTNMVIQDGQIIVNEFTERLVHGRNYFGLPKGHAIPTRNVSDENILKAKDIVTSLVKKLQIKDAVLYIQMIVTANGPKIVEVAPRLDGCHIWRLIKISKGYDLREFAIKCLLGEKINYSENKIDKLSPYYLRFYQMKPYSAFNTKNIEQVKDFSFIEFRYFDGEVVQPINGLLEVVGYYIVKG